MSTTKTKPSTSDEKTDEKTSEVESVDKVEALESVSRAVKRTIKYDGEKKVFVQKQLSFIHKTRFFRLLAGTLRLASDQEQSGILSVLDSTLGGFSSEGSPTEFIEGIMRLVELSPDFLEETFVIALNVKPEDQQWFVQAAEEFDDETAIDIIDVFIAQNAEPIKDFF